MVMLCCWCMLDIQSDRVYMTPVSMHQREAHKSTTNCIMGQAESKQTVPAVPITSNVGTTAGAFGGVGASTERSLEPQDIDADREKRAYERGKQESYAQIHKQLAIVANEVYSNVSEQLESIERQQSSSSKRTIDDLAEKLIRREARTDSCTSERENIIKCFKANSSQPLECKAVVDALSACAVATLHVATVDDIQVE